MNHCYAWYSLGSSSNPKIILVKLGEIVLSLKVYIEILFVWFDSLCPINNLSVIKGWAFLGWTSTKLGLMCLAHGHKAVTPMRLKPAAPRSWVKHSTIEPMCYFIHGDVVWSKLLTDTRHQMDGWRLDILWSLKDCWWDVKNQIKQTKHD